MNNNIKFIDSIGVTWLYQKWTVKSHGTTVLLLLEFTILEKSNII